MTDKKIPEKEEVNANLDGKKPSNTVTEGKRSYTLEGPKELIENNSYQLLAMNTFRNSKAGSYLLNGNKVTVED